MGAHDAPREHRRGTITLAVTGTAVLGTLGAGSFVAATSSGPGAPAADSLTGTPATWSPTSLSSSDTHGRLTPRPAPPAVPAAVTYTTVGGDTLSGIAERYHIPGGWEELWAANATTVPDPNKLKTGVELRLTGIALSPALSARLHVLLNPPAPQGTATPAGSQPSPGTSPAPSPPPAPVSPGTYQAYALSLFGAYGWDSSQFSGCLDPLWNRESGWSPTASNQSGAYGIPQALPGSKMASAGSDWETDGDTQIRWGLGYIKGTYGTPCGAWDHELADGWY